MDSNGVKKQRRRPRPQNRKRVLSSSTPESTVNASAPVDRMFVTVHETPSNKTVEGNRVFMPREDDVSTAAKQTRKRRQRGKKGVGSNAETSNEKEQLDSDVDMGNSDETAQTAAHSVPAPRISNEFLSTTAWSDPGIQKLLAKSVSHAIKDAFKFSHLTIIQNATLPTLLNGVDILAKAKTGGGKTLSFLIPAVQRLIDRNLVGTRDYVGVLVLAPTRELAQQIYDDAVVLTSTQKKQFRNRIIMGGTNIRGDQRALSTDAGEVSADILVATPGRCVDHIQNTPGFAKALSRTLIFVLDEADRMLDMGFAKELNTIFAALPKKNTHINFSSKNPRPNSEVAPITLQTMLFSATVPSTVLSIAKKYLTDSYEFVDTVGEDTMETNKQVSQEALILPLDKVYHGLFHILAAIARVNPSHKTIVFFPTARLTQYMANVCRRFVNASNTSFKVIEIHSRNTQARRNASSEEFRNSRGCVLFSSDVSARGLDYPDITDVIQVGFTDRENYIHRVGRTARAGKQGRGLLIVAENEARAVLSNISDIPIRPFQMASYGMSVGFQSTKRVVDVRSKKDSSAENFQFPLMDAVLNDILVQIFSRSNKDSDFKQNSEQSFAATLGFYNSLMRTLGWSDVILVQNVAALFKNFGVPEVPAIPKKTLGKMRLLGVPGLRAC